MVKGSISAPQLSVMLLLSAPLFLAACGGGGGTSLADELTNSRIAPVGSGEVQIDLDQKVDGSVSDSRVGLVAYASGIDPRRGQMVTAAGIQGTPNVGTEVQSGVVKYSSKFNHTIVHDVSRDSINIRGKRGTLRTEGRIDLIADFGAGTIFGHGEASPVIFGRLPSNSLYVDGKINGQSVSGTATVTYPVTSPIGTRRANIDTDLNGRIGDNGVIATYTGTDRTTTVAGGIVGVAN